MATSDAQKRAIKQYLDTEQGKAALHRAVEKYQSTEQGQQKLKEAQARFEATEKRKAYQREWKRAKRKQLKTDSNK